MKDEQVKVSKKFLESLDTEFSQEKQKLLSENQELRKILVKVIDALGNGGKISEECSLGFLQQIPEEVRLTILKLKYQPLNTFPRK